MSQPPAPAREYTLEEVAELVGREYGHVCSTVKALRLGHEEPRRPGARGPLRRLLYAAEVRRVILYFARHESRRVTDQVK